MLALYGPGGPVDRGTDGAGGGAGAIPAEAVWLDLCNPSPDEERAVEAALGVGVPTREEMIEIEPSSRLYEEDGALFMTATVVANAGAGRPESTAVTFVLAKHRLVTVRYAEPQPFKAFGAYAERHPAACASGEAAFAALLDAIVDRLADILELVGADVDALSSEIFARNAAAAARRPRGDLQEVLARVGRNGDLASKARESLASIGRLLIFSRRVVGARSQAEVQARLETLNQDVASLSDYASFLANKITFLLDATLGMINIEQNTIIKIFSVVAFVFLPPTLIASIYGMNFAFMPELEWRYGYPFALLLMVVSAILPYLFFKRRGWL